MKAKGPFIWLLLAALLIFGVNVAITFWLKPEVIQWWTFGPADVTRILTPLVLVALFIERALEVFITTWREDLGLRPDIFSCVPRRMIRARATAPSASLLYNAPLCARQRF